MFMLGVGNLGLALAATPLDEVSQDTGESSNIERQVEDLVSTKGDAAGEWVAELDYNIKVCLAIGAACIGMVLMGHADHIIMILFMSSVKFAKWSRRGVLIYLTFAFLIPLVAFVKGAKMHARFKMPRWRDGDGKLHGKEIQQCAVASLANLGPSWQSEALGWTKGDQIKYMLPMTKALRRANLGVLRGIAPSKLHQVWGTGRFSKLNPLSVMGRRMTKWKSRVIFWSQAKKESLMTSWLQVHSESLPAQHVPTQGEMQIIAALLDVTISILYPSLDDSMQFKRYDVNPLDGMLRPTRIYLRNWRSSYYLRQGYLASQVDAEPFATLGGCKDFYCSVERWLLQYGRMAQGMSERLLMLQEIDPQFNESGLGSGKAIMQAVNEAVRKKEHFKALVYNDYMKHLGSTWSKKTPYDIKYLQGVRMKMRGIVADLEAKIRSVSPSFSLDGKPLLQKLSQSNSSMSSLDMRELLLEMKALTTEARELRVNLEQASKQCKSGLRDVTKALKKLQEQNKTPGVTKKIKELEAVRQTLIGLRDTLEQAYESQKRTNSQKKS